LETALRQLHIDTFRLYTMFFVVWAHVQFFGSLDKGSSLAKAAELAIIISVRYAIPFFFIVAGYFTGGKIVQEPSKAIAIAGQYTSRLAVIFLFWCVVYALERPQNVLSLAYEQPIKLISEGTRVHLWFLMSLILTVWLFALWPFRKSPKSFLLLGGILYTIGLLAGSYNVTPIGFDLNINTCKGPFFGTLFFAIGVALRNRMPRLSKRAAACMALAGLAIFSLEAILIRLRWFVHPIMHDYLLGSIPYGVGASLLIMTKPDSDLDRRVSPFSRYVLGIYVIHMLFIDLLKPLGAFVQPLVWQLVFPMVVFGLSLLASMLIAKTPLRRVVV
jgi:surface polysaccharide O-acyltransferase-like enzyme